MKKNKIPGKILVQKMSFVEQQNFSTLSTISKNALLHKMIRLQKEIDQLKELYLRQCQNIPEKTDNKDRSSHNILVTDEVFSAVRQSIPVAIQFMPVGCQTIVNFRTIVKGSIPVDYHLISIENQYNNAIKPSPKNGKFFRSYSQLDSKNHHVTLKWPVAKIIWWGEDIPPLKRLKRDLWQGFDRPPDKCTNTKNLRLEYFKEENVETVFLKPENV